MTPFWVSAVLRKRARVFLKQREQGLVHRKHTHRHTLACVSASTHLGGHEPSKKYMSRWFIPWDVKTLRSYWLLFSRTTRLTPFLRTKREGTILHSFLTSYRDWWCNCGLPFVTKKWRLLYDSLSVPRSALITDLLTKRRFRWCSELSKISLSRRRGINDIINGVRPRLAQKRFCVR